MSGLDFGLMSRKAENEDENVFAPQAKLIFNKPGQKPMLVATTASAAEQLSKHIARFNGATYKSPKAKL